jgi:curved DNA-binding protein CbpA
MTPQSGLELKGTFYTHPFAEILVEIAQAELSGSIRTSDGEKKCVVYFRAGRIVFAASNQRSDRMFAILLKRGVIKKDDLANIPNFANDFELTGLLVERSVITKEESDRVFAGQIEAIVVDILTWANGEWSFSPLARLREGLSFNVDPVSHLMNYSRCMSEEAIFKRFRSLGEMFARSTSHELGRDLTPQEGFVLSRVESEPASAAEIVALCSTFPQVTVLRSLYVLWMGGLVRRSEWPSALPAAFITAVKSAKLELKSEAKDLHSVSAQPTRAASTGDAKKEAVSPSVEEQVQQPAQPETPALSLDKYLKRVEDAATYYDILGVDAKAESDELKKAYFALAKSFHPDRFHTDNSATLKRVQHAFTELAHAYETLKSTESRELYDFRIRKELAEREKQQASGSTGTAYMQATQAADNFDRGFNLLMENQPDAAVPFLARAAHFAPKNARYRAYHGKALSFDEKQRHKAEAEMQAALKVDPNNVTFRIMLAEFFIQFKLMKRAEGELNRLLAIFPSNQEARNLLNSIKAKV